MSRGHVMEDTERENVLEADQASDEDNLGDAVTKRGQLDPDPWD